MGLFGGKDDTKAKIDELKQRMQQQGGQQQNYPQQPWQKQQQEYQAPQQSWQPPRQERRPQEPPAEPARPQESYTMDYSREEETTGIVIDLGDGMSLNLPVKSHMRLDEFLKLSDRVRELKRIDHPQQHY